MRPSKIRAAMNSGQVTYGLTLTFPAESIVEWAGYLGFDVLHLDCEHGVFDWESIERMCRTADMHGMTCTARIPNIDSDTILRTLDRGVMGILAPHVDTREQAEHIAKVTRFGPEGERSFGTSRGRDYGLSGKSAGEYMADFNREVTIAIQIETAQAVENIDSLLEVDGIDMFTFGPQDLAQSLGRPGNPGAPEVTAAMKKVVDRVHDAGRKMTSDVEKGINLVQWLPPKLAEWLDDIKQKG
ncbi:MAG: aldolase/citrate lyase family protein [Dehalococcoidia bacterium]